jgi:putative transposase
VVSAQQKDGQMKAQFADEQIIAIIKEQETDETTADVCRLHEISSAAFYKYKPKYSGLEWMKNTA